MIRTGHFFIPSMPIINYYPPILICPTKNFCIVIGVTDHFNIITIILVIVFPIKLI